MLLIFIYNYKPFVLFFFLFLFLFSFRWRSWKAEGGKEAKKKNRKTQPCKERMKKRDICIL